MEKKNTKEVNLLDIFAAIWQGIVKTVSCIVSIAGKTLQLLFRHKVLTIILLLLAFAISQYHARPSNRKYHTGGMAVLYGVEAKTVMQLGNQLSVSSPRFEETSLARKLNIPDSVSKKITEIRFFNVIDYKNDSVPDKVDFNNNHSLSDTLNVRMKDHVYIRIKTIGTGHAPEVSEAVMKYINSNSMVQTEFEAWKNTLKQRIVVAELESKRIDSLAKIKYFQESKPNIKFDNNQLLVGNQHTQLFYADMLFIQKSFLKQKPNFPKRKIRLLSLPALLLTQMQPTAG